MRGQRGREYKISVIHLRTRLKYSEIHAQATSRQVAAVLERSVSRLPPFHLVVTDNAMIFTMAYTAHPERQTTFERTIARLGLRHWRIGCRKPWQNGIIERSNRTDNDECFHQQIFTSSEERRYVHRLWEMHARPHRAAASRLAGTRPADHLSARLSVPRGADVCANLMNQYT